MQNRTIIINATDYQRLEALVRDAVASHSTRRDLLVALQNELDRAKVVDPQEIPGDVVTMNSKVVLRDLESDEVEAFTLVYPGFADISQGRLSILTPMGMAIIGYRVGDVIQWEFPSGLRTMRVEEILYQPERTGQYDL